MNKTIK